MGKNCRAGSDLNGKIALPAGDGADHQKRLGSFGDGVGQRSVRRFVGEIFMASKKSDERPALLRHMVAHRTAQHRIASLKCVQGGALSDHACYFERNLALDARQGSQMLGKDHSNHGGLSTSKAIDGRWSIHFIVGLHFANRPEHFLMFANKLKQQFRQIVGVLKELGIETVKYFTLFITDPRNQQFPSLPV